MGRLKDVLENGEFAVTCEIAPPKGCDISHILKCIDILKGKVDAVNVTDFQSAVVRSTSLAICKILKDNGIEPVLQMTGRDRNRIAIQGELLSAGIFGIENLFAITGDHTSKGDHPQSKNVFDLDSINILKAAELISYGKDMRNNDLKGHPRFYMGAAVSPAFEPIEIQIIKMIKKIAAGARFFQTQAVFDIETVRRFREITKNFDCKVMIGVIPLKSPRMAKFLNENIPGVDVPENIIERMESVGKDNYREEGIKIAAEFIKKLKEENLCDGVHIMSVGAEKNIPKIIEMSGIKKL